MNSDNLPDFGKMPDCDMTGKIFVGEESFNRLCKRRGFSVNNGCVEINGAIKFIRHHLLKPNQIITCDPKLVKIMKEYDKSKGIRLRP